MEQNYTFYKVHETDQKASTKAEAIDLARLSVWSDEKVFICSESRFCPNKFLGYMGDCPYCYEVDPRDPRTSQQILDDLDRDTN